MRIKRKDIKGFNLKIGKFVFEFVFLKLTPIVFSITKMSGGKVIYTKRCERKNWLMRYERR